MGATQQFNLHGCLQLRKDLIFFMVEVLIGVLVQFFFTENVHLKKKVNQ